MLEIRRQAATPYGEGVTLNNLGETFLALGRFDEAVDRLTQARQIFHDIEEIRGEGYALAISASAYLALGHTADAIGVLERALELRQASAGERFDEAHTLRDLGRAYQLAGQDRIGRPDCLRQAADEELHRSRESRPGSRPSHSRSGSDRIRRRLVI